MLSTESHARRLGSFEFHYRRYGSYRSAGGREAIAEGVRLAKGATRFDGVALPADHGAQNEAAEGRADARRSRRSEGERGGDAAGLIARRHLRQRQILQVRAEREMSGHRRHHAHHGQQHERGRACRRVDAAGTRSRRPCAAILRASSSWRTKGARELGFKDTGAMWRAKYDMPPDDFANELDRLWDQVRPLYVSLHAYVRTKLREKYGPMSCPPTARSPRICWATSGRRIGPTFINWSRRRTPIRATI